MSTIKGKIRDHKWLDYKEGLGDQFDDEVGADTWIDLNVAIERSLGTALYEEIAAVFSDWDEDFEDEFYG